MHTGNGKTARSAPTTRDSNEVNAEQTPQTRAEGDRAAAPRAETKRPWAVRQANGPSWVEKIEQF